MSDSRQVSNIRYFILDKSISKTQQVLSIIKAVSHCSLIKHVKIAGLIVPSKEIKVAVFHQTNTKTIIKETLITKKSQLRAADEKRLIAMTNINVCYSSKKPQSTSDHTSTLDQIKYSGVSISNGYRWKSKSRKKRKQLIEGEDELWAPVKRPKKIKRDA